MTKPEHSDVPQEHVEAARFGMEIVAAAAIQGAREEAERIGKASPGRFGPNIRFRKAAAEQFVSWLDATMRKAIDQSLAHSIKWEASNRRTTRALDSMKIED